ncbi:MAG: formyltetrahydrofolate deformylase [Verrucomicrobiales bacterium]
MATSTHNAILLISCPDQAGLVSLVAEFIRRHNGNIIYLDQHVDTQHRAFFMRIEWELQDFKLSDEDLPRLFQEDIASPMQMNWQLHYSDQRPRVAIFATRESHCLYDLLSRHQAGELDVGIPLIISNGEDLRSAAERFEVPFAHFPITPENKAAQEAAEMELLKSHTVDTLVLARYMQILSDSFVNHYPEKIINIHHSFLPAFAGARPYHQAYERGVKLVGATSHYVTAQLDEGPIITQDVIHVSHRESVPDFVRRGRDLEKVVLARAVWAHAQRKVLVFKNKTVVFS